MPADLNCHAVHGGTSRCGGPSQCSAITDAATCQALPGCSWIGTVCGGGVDATNCDTTGETCHYDAADAAQLSAAFNDIAGRIASCSYTIDGTPPDLDRIFVYSDMANGSSLAWVGRDYSRQDGRDLDTATSPPKVNFFGPACDALLNLQANPVVVYGCCIGEGC